MIPCVYSKQKKKKLKTWLDGFITLKNNKMRLYDEDKKMIDSKTMNKLTNEIETMRHVIYVETECNIEREEVCFKDEKMFKNESLKQFDANKDDELIKNEDETNEFSDESELCQDKQISRSNEDIINLFKSAK